MDEQQEDIFDLCPFEYVNQFDTVSYEVGFDYDDGEDESNYVNEYKVG